MQLFVTEQNYLPLVTSVADKYQIPAALVLAHIKEESKFNPNAYRAEPTLGDASIGIGQILLGTAKRFDPSVTESKLYDPSYNADMMGQIISVALSKYRNNMQDEMAAYNAGTPMKNDRGQYINTKGDTKVQGYVDRVTRYFNTYNDWLASNAPAVQTTAIDPFLVGAAIFVLGLVVVRKKYG
jgi:soluble lytic murein transglycosylase-like protein